MNPIWADKNQGAITVTDKDDIIIYMNEKSIKTFESYGGADIIGTNIKEWHNEHSNKVIDEIKETGKANAYTIEKNGVKKIIYQTPYYDNNEYAGMVEFSFEIPFDMPHYKRS